MRTISILMTTLTNLTLLFPTPDYLRLLMIPIVHCRGFDIGTDGPSCGKNIGGYEPHFLRSFNHLS